MERKEKGIFSCRRFASIIFFNILFCISAHISAGETKKKLNNQKKKIRYRYAYIDREHTFKEDLKNIGILYGMSILAYYITQPNTVKNHGSFSEYRKNFGRLTFDRDEPFWNWMVHPYTGSQSYLFYRANGYERFESMKMTAIVSTLFELTIEIYTERPSIQDLYQTPILGSVLGYGIEKLSLYLLNRDFFLFHAVGYFLNPFLLFGFYDGPIEERSNLSHQLFFKNNKTNKVVGSMLSLSF